MTTSLAPLMAYLRPALWGVGGEPLSLPVFDLDVARRQGVAGLVFDGLQALYAAWGDEVSQRVPRGVRMSLWADVAALERLQASYDACLDELSASLVASGARPVCLKGNTLRALYPEGAHRGVGDMDFFFPSEHALRTANEWALRHGTCHDDLNEKHFEFSYRGFHVEHHAWLVLFARRSYTRRLHALAVDALQNGGGEPMANGCATPPPTLCALFLLAHLSEHLLEGGLTLKPVVDWAVFLSSRAGDVDGDLLRRWTAQFGLTRLAEGFTRLAVCDLGLDARLAPFDLSRGERARRLILADLERGNRAPRGYFRKTLFKMSRYARLLSLWPSEAASAYAFALRRLAVRVRRGRL